MYLRTLSNDELLLHVDNLPESLRTPLVIELARRLEAAPTDDLVADLMKEVSELQRLLPSP